MMQGMITMLKMLGLDPDKIQADLAAGLAAIQDFHQKLDTVIAAMQAVDARLTEVENFMRDHVTANAQFVPVADTAGVVLPAPEDHQLSMPEPIGTANADTPAGAQATEAVDPSVSDPVPA